MNGLQRASCNVSSQGCIPESHFFFLSKRQAVLRVKAARPPLNRTHTGECFETFATRLVFDTTPGRSLTRRYTPISALFFDPEDVAFPKGGILSGGEISRSATSPPPFIPSILIPVTFSLHRVASSRVRSSYSQPTSSLRSKFDGQECVPSSSRDSSSFSRRRQRRALDLVFSFLFCFCPWCCPSPPISALNSSEAVSIHPQLDPHLVSVIIKKATKKLLITVLINDVKKDQRKANKNQACYRHDSFAIKIEPYKFATMHFTLGFGDYNAGRENRKLGEEPRRNPPWLGRGAAE